MCHPTSDIKAEDHSDPGVSDKASNKRSFLKIESSEDDAPISPKRPCMSNTVLSLPGRPTRPWVVSVMELKRSWFHDHRPLCGVSLKVDDDQTPVNLVIPTELIEDDDESILIFTHADTTFADIRMLREDGGTEDATGRPARNVLWQGEYPCLSRRQIVLVAGGCWFKVNLTHGDPVMCFKPNTTTPSFCFNDECPIAHSSYIRLSGEMRIWDIPTQMEAWTFPLPTPPAPSTDDDDE
ncbi:hypothetical protein AYL99_04667 [Fonsecaea erecta]|uniref:Uncharacterized protein n=1 Tax=Fonsecaea erecta TaxID=1367422 RepID=A0A178ZRL3_9EURO|nr:hypothetical protein AYL99_04667 [Fonsecaea erecta]OAP62464.1 hypothetical protein AYL99_04667 [Fonsecaea erecta]